MNQEPNNIRFFRKKAKLTLEELGVLINTGASTILKLEKGTQALTESYMHKISDALNQKGIKVKPADLMRNQPIEIILDTPPRVIPAGTATYGPEQIPVYALETKAKGRLELNEIGRTLIHPRQHGIKKVAAIHAFDDSLSPRYKTNQLLYVISGPPLNKGDEVIIEKSNGDWLMIEIASTGEIISGLQKNNRQIKVNKSEVKNSYIIVGT